MYTSAARTSSPVAIHFIRMRCPPPKKKPACAGLWT
jgi:hypothetical protein